MKLLVTTIFSFIVGLYVGYVTIDCVAKTGSEMLPDFSNESLVIINTELIEIRAKLDDHEDRLVAGGL